MRYGAFEKSTGVVLRIYDSVKNTPSPEEFKGIVGDLGACVHLRIPESLDENYIKMAVIDGVPTVVEDLSSAWVDLRSVRDQKLFDSDYTQLLDAPISPDEQSLWASYRKKLRDLPENTEDPRKPVWPIKGV